MGSPAGGCPVHHPASAPASSPVSGPEVDSANDPAGDPVSSPANDPAGDFVSGPAGCSSDPLTPAARALADSIAAAFGDLGPNTDIAAQRRRTSRPPDPRRRPASVTDRTIPGPAPGSRLRVRVYRSAGTPATDAPALLFFHGGGWVLCSLDTHDGLCRELTHLTGALVVSVDYRLAPEHPAPAAVEDAYAALRWATSHLREEEGGDPRRIAVAGDSAGGNLAAAVCLLAAERGCPLPVAQFLAYPVLDARLATESMRTYGDGRFFLTAAHMRWYWGHYLAGAAPTPHTAPCLASDEALRLMPPAYVLTAECDPLRDEGDAFAARLTTVRHRTAPGVFHGFLDFFPQLPQAREALDDAAVWLRDRLAARR
ncbi:alpha/beta hydrolase [Streptomyces albus]